MFHALRSRLIRKEELQASEHVRPQKRRKQQRNDVAEPTYSHCYHVTTRPIGDNPVSMDKPAKRQIWAMDLGTSCAAVAVTEIPAGKSGADVTERQILNIDEYKDDRPNGGLSSTFVPTYIDFGEVRGDRIRWGWEVRKALLDPQDTIHTRQDDVFCNFKLMLDGTDETAETREQLHRKICHLKALGIIDSDDDMIVEYLESWMSSVKDRYGDRIDRTISHPEFVIGVPIAWSAKRSARWVKAFDRAIRVVWASHSDQKPPAIYTIAEPAAASSYYLFRTHDELHEGECIMVIDGGGGTVQSITYEKTAKGHKQIGETGFNSLGGVIECLHTLPTNCMVNLKHTWQE